MDWLEQNLDAYRIIAEILEDLRETLRLRLDQVHGQKWYETSLPDGLLDRLVVRKDSASMSLEEATRGRDEHRRIIA